MIDESRWRRLTAVPVSVGTKTYSWWSIDHNMDRVRYALGLNPGIIKYKLNAYLGLEGIHRATALRQLQHEASEFLFALLGACAGGFDTLPAWLTLYENSDVYQFADHIMSSKGRESYLTLIQNIIDDGAVRISIDGFEKKGAIVHETIYFHLKSIYREYIDVHAKSEYVSTKHSYRVTEGESSFKISFDNQTFHQVIGGENSVSHVTSRRLSRSSSIFAKGDVYIYHSTSIYSIEHLKKMIELVSELTEIIVQCVKYKMHPSTQAVELNLTSHRSKIDAGRAFSGNGRVVETAKKFRREPNGNVYGTFDMDLNFDFPIDPAYQFISNSAKPYVKNHGIFDDFAASNIVEAAT